MSKEYAVPKREVAAELTMSGHRPIMVTLFLSYGAERHDGYERPSDLLNSSAIFLPVRVKADGFVFIRRQSILVLSVRFEDEHDEEGAEELAASQATTTNITVTMEDGSTVNGLIRYILPEGQRRLQNYLNTVDEFIRLEDRDMVRFLNKHRIVQVSLVAAEEAGHAGD